MKKPNHNQSTQQKWVCIQEILFGKEWVTFTSQPCSTQMEALLSAQELMMADPRFNPAYTYALKHSFSTVGCQP